MKSFQLIDLEIAKNHIQQACKKFKKVGSPFIFLVGAGISYPPVPLASKIIEDCIITAGQYGATTLPPEEDSIDKYSYWFRQAYPQPIDRQIYLRNLIEYKAISAANFRLALIFYSSIQNIHILNTNTCLHPA